eukprot:31237-Rhodomonas_salina.1
MFINGGSKILTESQPDVVVTKRLQSSYGCLPDGPPKSGRRIGILDTQGTSVVNFVLELHPGSHTRVLQPPEGTRSKDTTCRAFVFFTVRLCVCGFSDVRCALRRRGAAKQKRPDAEVKHDRSQEFPDPQQQSNISHRRGIGLASNRAKKGYDSEGGGVAGETIGSDRRLHRVLQGWRRQTH